MDNGNWLQKIRLTGANSLQEAGLKKYKNTLLASALLVAGFILLYALDREWRQSNFEQARLTTEITSQQLRIRLQTCIEPRISAINMVAVARWNSPGEIIAEWDPLVYPLVDLLPGIQAINYIDTDRVIRHVYPREPNLAALGADLSASNNLNVLSTLRRAEATGTLVRTQPLELLQSGMGFAMYKTLTSPDGELLGYVNGVFRISDLVEACFFEQSLQDQFQLSLRDGNDTLIYQSGVEADDLDSSLMATQTVDVAGQPWTLELIPAPSLVSGAGGMVQNVWLGFGAFILLVLAFTSRSLLNKQDSLAQSQELYRMLVEHQTDLLVKADNRGRMQYVSPSTCRLLGKSEKELLNREFWPLVYEPDQATTREELKKLNRNHPSHYLENRVYTSRGLRWLAWSQSAVLNEKDEIEAVYAVGRDITEIKRLQAQVSQNQKMQAVSDLASGLTHDFNNLLHITLSNVELLRDEVNSESARESLEHIYAAVQSGMTLSAKLSSLSRENKTLQGVHELNSLVRNAVKFFANSNSGDLRTESEIPEVPLQVYCDRSQIERVMFNLLLNARDAIDGEGYIRVTLESAILDDEFCNSHANITPGHYAKITLLDNGRGISGGQLSRIFDPYFTTKSNESNTGLGLANSYSIVQQHGGLILADSTLGEGATFTVYLPLIMPEQAPDSDGAEVGKSEVIHKALMELADQKKEGPLVLVVDDRPEILALTRETLEREGIRVIGCQDGAACLELFERFHQQLALVLLDRVMPDRQGDEIADELASIDPRVKILLMSGVSPDRSDDLAYPLLTKPFTRKELLDRVRPLLDASAL